MRRYTFAAVVVISLLLGSVLLTATASAQVPYTAPRLPCKQVPLRVIESPYQFMDRLGSDYKAFWEGYMGNSWGYFK